MVTRIATLWRIDPSKPDPAIGLFKKVLAA